MLSDLQKTKLSQLFKIIDTNHDGGVDASDLDRLAHNVAGERGWKPGSQQYEALRARYQMQLQPSQPFMKGGKLDLNGYLAFHDQLLNVPGAYDSMVRALAEFVFDTLDADGSGKISAKELTQFYRAYGLSEAAAQASFKALDTNHDGALSRAEVTDMVAQFYFSSDPAAPGNNLFGPISVAIPA
jgi:hypothetical protein